METKGFISKNNKIITCKLKFCETRTNWNDFQIFQMKNIKNNIKYICYDFLE